MIHFYVEVKKTEEQQWGSVGLHYAYTLERDLSVYLFH